MVNAVQDRAWHSRSRIIDAARAALLAGRGDFELADLARRAGVSVGLPYHRFGSKSGVIAAVVAEFYAGLRRALDLGDFAPLDWSVRERERLGRLVAYLHGDPLAPLIISTLGRDPEVSAVEAGLWRETIDAAARNLAHAQARGQIARDLDPQLAAAMVCGGVRHAVGLGLGSRKRPSQAALVDAIWTFIARALRLDLPVAPSAPKRARARAKLTGQRS
jgi:AcrR family transcriptional regulator